MMHCKLDLTLQKTFVKTLGRAATGLPINMRHHKLGSPVAAFTSCTVASLLQPRSSSCRQHRAHAHLVTGDADK